jgi:SAM-dependent methyltransferase
MNTCSAGAAAYFGSRPPLRRTTLSVSITPAMPVMSEPLLSLLRCPFCKGLLNSRSEALGCSTCGNTYPIIRGIPRFVGDESYSRNFGFQWRLHQRTQLDPRPGGASERFLRESLGLSPESIREKRVLDAGCGAGRYAEVLSRWGGNVVAMDLSLAVEACYRNLGDRENVTVVQADIFNPPFEPESFDVIVSIGVLHHTPDPRQAFRSLVGLLKPGGLIGIWVYHAYHDDTLRMKLSQFYRRWTRRMPLRVLYALCHLAIPWYYLNRTPLIRTISGRFWILSTGIVAGISPTTPTQRYSIGFRRTGWSGSSLTTHPLPWLA